MTISNSLDYLFSLTGKNFPQRGQLITSSDLRRMSTTALLRTRFDHLNVRNRILDKIIAFLSSVILRSLSNVFNRVAILKTYWKRLWHTSVNKVTAVIWKILTKLDIWNPLYVIDNMAYELDEEPFHAFLNGVTYMPSNTTCLHTSGGDSRWPESGYPYLAYYSGAPLYFFLRLIKL